MQSLFLKNCAGRFPRLFGRSDRYRYKMKFPFDFINDYAEIADFKSRPDDLARLLTEAGLETEVSRRNQSRLIQKKLSLQRFVPSKNIRMRKGFRSVRRIRAAKAAFFRLSAAPPI